MYVIHLDQDDPRKCTARKICSLGLAKLHDSAISAPRRGFLLDPESDVIIGPEDRPLTKMGGSLVALDCSWKKINDSLLELRGGLGYNQKTTKASTANSVSWGKVGRLSSSKALTSLYALVTEQAEILLEKFQFGEQFLQLNREPLLEYSHAETREHMGIIENRFFDNWTSLPDWPDTGNRVTYFRPVKIVSYSRVHLGCVPDHHTECGLVHQVSYVVDDVHVIRTHSTDHIVTHHVSEWVNSPSYSNDPSHSLACELYTVIATRF